jgi:hypothetical protein
MITIKEGSAVFTVREENAEKYRAIIHKAKKPKGKWPKQGNPKGNPKHSSMHRDYPAFHANMTTGQYIMQYQKLNGRLNLSKCHDIDSYRNIAPRLDPAYLECEESDL